MPRSWAFLLSLPSALAVTLNPHRRSPVDGASQTTMRPVRARTADGYPTRRVCFVLQPPDWRVSGTAPRDHGPAHLARRTVQHPLFSLQPGRSVMVPRVSLAPARASPRRGVVRTLHFYVPHTVPQRSQQ